MFIQLCELSPIKIIYFFYNILYLSRIPPGTSAQLTDLLHNLLKRNPKERIDFNAFFTHPFLATAPVAVPKSPSPVEEEKAMSSPETAGFVVVPPMPKSKPIPVPHGKSEPNSQNNSPSTVNKKAPTTPSSGTGSNRSVDAQPTTPKQKQSESTIIIFNIKA